MDFYQTVRERFSARSYIDKPIENEKLKRIMQAVQNAPSAKNMQDWKFYLIKNKELKDKLQVAAKNQPFVAQADIIVVGVGTLNDYQMTCGYHTYIIDLSIALEHLSLAATAEGLGTCWIGAYYKDQVKEVLNLPENEEPVQLMTLGYTDDSGRKTSRKELNEIFEIIE